MTKAKLARLIELSKSTAILRPYREYEELVALQAEFAAWEPDEQPAVYHVEVDPEHPAWGKE